MTTPDEPFRGHTAPPRSQAELEARRMTAASHAAARRAAPKRRTPRELLSNRAIAMVTINEPVDDWKVVAPAAYVGGEEVTSSFGPLLLVCKDGAAWPSLRAFLVRTIELGDRVFGRYLKDEFDHAADRENAQIAATGEVPAVAERRPPRPDMGIGL